MTHKSVKCWLRGQVISFPFKTIRWNDGGGAGDEVHNRVITERSLNSECDSCIGEGRGWGLWSDGCIPSKSF